MKVKVSIVLTSIVSIALIQSTVLNYAAAYGVKPNLMLVFIVCFSLLRGNVEGAVAGFSAGLVQDIVSGKIMGFYSLLGLYLGVVVGSLNKRLYRENILVALFFTFTSTVVYEFLVYFFAVFLPGDRNILFALKGNILPEAVYNSVISGLIFLIVLKMHRKMEEAEKAARRY